MERVEKRQYRGMLTKKERDEADKRLTELKKIIPELEERLFKKYRKKNNLYRYELGLKLIEFVKKHNVSTKERQYYWEDLREYASREEHQTKDRSDKRQDYEYCYQLGLLGRKTVVKLSWRQWQDILDRKNILEDKRIFDWLKKNDFKIKEQIWRDFTKALNLYFKNVDTIVYDDREMLSDFDVLYLVVNEWNNLVKKYFGKIDNMSKARKQNLTKYKKKYYEDIIYIMRMEEEYDIELECDKIFVKHYVIN